MFSLKYVSFGDTMKSNEQLHQLIMKKSQLYQELDFIEQEIKIIKNQQNKGQKKIYEESKESSWMIHIMFFGIIFLLIYFAYLSEKSHTTNFLLASVALFLFDLLFCLV